MDYYILTSHGHSVQAMWIVAGEGPSAATAAGTPLKERSGETWNIVSLLYHKLRER